MRQPGDLNGFSLARLIPGKPYIVAPIRDAAAAIWAVNPHIPDVIGIVAKAGGYTGKQVAACITEMRRVEVGIAILRVIQVKFITIQEVDARWVHWNV